MDLVCDLVGEKRNNNKTGVFNHSGSCETGCEIVLRCTFHLLSENDLNPRKLSVKGIRLIYATLLPCVD